MLIEKTNITVVGLGYVGLPLFIELSKKFNVKGYDNDIKKIQKIKKNKVDFIKTKNILNRVISSDLNKCVSDIYIICLPTPTFKNKKPDLRIISNCLKKLKKIIKKNDLIIFESTYYPGTTEYLARKYISDKNFILKKDYAIAYSPERINPGDKINTLKRTTKLISSIDKKSLNKVKKIYSKICDNIHICKSIEIAEMSKLIENSQRDINIAYMNDIFKICNKYNLNFEDVFNAAKTKWNFLDFKPGLVGGHCIAVDSYYLSQFAKDINQNIDLIDAARNVNEKMIEVYYNILKKKLEISDKILLLGYSFKENVSDIRNSKNLLLVKKIKKKYLKTYSFDPYVENNTLEKFISDNQIKYKSFDKILVLVKHKYFKQKMNIIKKLLKRDGKFMKIIK